MRALKVSFYLSGIIFLAACSTKVVGIYNSGSLSAPPKSFHVYFPEEEESFSKERQKLDQQLVEIIFAELESRQLKKSSLPDLYVSFIISVHTSEEINENNMNPYDYRYRNYNYGYYDPYRFNSRSYKEGVFIIDIRNSDNKLVWQGSKSFKLNAKNSSSEELIATCREVIASFDPGQVR